MKTTLLLFLTLGFLSLSFTGEDDDKIKKLPSVDIKDLNGKTMNTAELSNEGKPMIISFWATWCGPCKKELNNIAEVYDEWVDETGVKLVAISIDNARFSSRVKTYTATEGWEYEVYQDANSDFFRAMNGNTPPMTLLIDGNGNIVYQHIGYAEGDEDELYEHLLELTEE